jgi:hypothetical protein
MIKEPAVNKIHRAPRAALVYFSIVLFAAAFASLIASCTDSVGIFASLSQEKPIGTLSTKELSSVSPACVVRYNVAGTDYFFMSSGLIYKRPLTLAKESWTAIQSAPANASRCLQITAADRLFAAWLDDNFLNRGLYASSNAVDWTAIGAATLSSESSIIRQITGLFTLNNTVFVAVKESNYTTGNEVVIFKLYYVSGNDVVPCTFNTDPDVDSNFDNDLKYDSDNPYVTTSIRSMTWDGTDYWFVSGSSIYRGSTVSQFAKVTETGVPGGVSFTAINWSAELNRILVSTGSGVFKVGETMTGITPGLIYARTAAGVWETSNPSVLVSSTSGGYANFTDILTVPGNVAGSPVVVASAASSLKYGDGKSQSNKAAATRGYGVLVPDADLSITGHSAISRANVISSWSSYETSLMDYAVTGLFYLDGESGSKVLFACTAGRGLWSNRRSSDGNWGDWEKE